MNARRTLTGYNEMARLSDNEPQALCSPRFTTMRRRRQGDAPATPLCSGDLTDREDLDASPPSARGGEKTWAGAPRPKAEITDDGPESLGNENAARQPAASSTICKSTNPDGKSLSLKLREQAKRLGLKPGSPRWRAYVLGTQAAARKRGR